MATQEKEIVRLDLGCGSQKKEGFKGVDLHEKNADFKFDLLVFPWPIESDSVDELHCQHFFEHIPAKLRVPFMDECWRILIPDGKFTLISPYYSSMRAIQDPTHEWPPICEASFLYFNKKWREDNKLTHYLGTCNFDFTYGYNFYPDIAPRNDEARQFSVSHYINAAMDIQVNLTKIK